MIGHISEVSGTPPPAGKVLRIHPLYRKPLPGLRVAIHTFSTRSVTKI